VPDGFTPLKLITFIEEATLCDKVAVTATLVSDKGANARQISEVPFCAFSLTTSAHVNPPPATDATVVFVPDGESVAIRASSSSLPVTVENIELVIVLLGVG
jgi:hypothetical protein